MIKQINLEDGILYVGGTGDIKALCKSIAEIAA